jgi:hypothetical protein
MSPSCKLTNRYTESRKQTAWRRSQSPSITLNCGCLRKSSDLLHYGFHQCIQHWSVTAFKLTWSGPGCAYPTLLDHHPLTYLQAHWMMASKSIYQLAALRHPRLNDPGVAFVSLNSLNLGIHTPSIMSSMCITNFTQSAPSGTCWIVLNQHLQPVHIYCVDV